MIVQIFSYIYNMLLQSNFKFWYKMIKLTDCLAKWKL